MTDEQRAKRNEYMRNYYKNLSRYQKEKRRLKNLEQKKQKYHDKTPEEKAKRKEANRENYLKTLIKSGHTQRRTAKNKKKNAYRTRKTKIN